MFLARIFWKKWRCGDFFIFTKYDSRWSSVEKF